MQQLPRDMLYVLRTNNLVRGLNKELGGSSRSRFWTTATEALYGTSDGYLHRNLRFDERNGIRCQPRAGTGADWTRSCTKLPWYLHPSASGQQRMLRLHEDRPAGQSVGFQTPPGARSPAKSGWTRSLASTAAYATDWLALSTVFALFELRAVASSWRSSGAASLPPAEQAAVERTAGVGDGATPPRHRRRHPDVSSFG